MDQRETRHAAREIKFVTDAALRPSIVQWAREHFGPDGHGAGIQADEYSTATLYLETPEFHVYRRCGSYGRSKYRIRRYGESDLVFIERKFRTSRLLAKRRTLIPLAELQRLHTALPDASWQGYWFHRRMRLRRIEPLIQLSYDRVARVGTSETGPVRMTIDTNLHVLPMRDLAFLPGAGQPFLQGSCIVEVKFRARLPAIVRQFAGDLGLGVQKISKFRAALRSLDYPRPADSDEQVSTSVDAIDSDTAGRFAD
jgi:hypothetical protein